MKLHTGCVYYIPLLAWLALAGCADNPRPMARQGIAASTEKSRAKGTGSTTRPRALTDQAGFARKPLLRGAQADSITVFKRRHVLALHYRGRVLKRYRVALGTSPAGPKRQEGDRKTPEGLYTIDSRNLNSDYHKALHISYPNPADKKRAARLRVSPGGDVMIHGLPNGKGWIGERHRLKDWTWGCIALTDQEVDELWRAVPAGTPIRILP